MDQQFGEKQCSSSARCFRQVLVHCVNQEVGEVELSSALLFSNFIDRRKCASVSITGASYFLQLLAEMFEDDAKEDPVCKQRDAAPFNLRNFLPVIGA